MNISKEHDCHNLNVHEKIDIVMGAVFADFQSKMILYQSLGAINRSLEHINNGG